MSEIQVPSHLRAAVINQRIYPPGSPMVERSVGQIMQALQVALKAGESVTYTSRQGRLFVKGQEIPDASTLCPYLDEHGIQSLTFHPGATQEEVSQLVLLLSKKKQPGLQPAAWLAEQKVANIAIDKVTVVEVMEGEVVMKKFDALFNNVRDFPALMNSMRESFELMEKMPDEREKTKVQEHMARKMSGLSPVLLRDMFENELPKKMEDSGIKTLTLNAMTQDKIHEIFSDIGDWYRDIRDSSSSELEVVEHLSKLKSFLGKILKSPSSKKVPFSLYEELLGKGLLDEIPPDIERTVEKSLAQQVDELLEKPPEELLEQPLRDQLPGVMKRLCEVGLDDQALKLVEKLVKNFLQGPVLLRQMAVRTARQFLDTLAAARKERLWTLIATALERMAEAERSADMYKDVAEALVPVAVQYVLRERPGEAARLLGQLRRHRHDADPVVPRRPEMAAAALEAVARKLTDILMDDLLSQDAVKKESAQAVLAELGEAAVPCFLLIVKKSPDLRQRRLAAGVLKYYGDAAKSQLAAEFHLGAPTEVLLNVLSILDDFLTPELTARFETFLHYPDATIRRRIIQLLAKLPESSGELMVRFLDDEDETVQIDAIRAAGEARVRGAVGRLLELLKSGSTRRLEDTCLALGQLADPAAVEPLAEIVEQKSGLFKKRSSTEETVRVRAAWALAQIKSSSAREALNRVAKDPNLQIQTIVQNALKNAAF
jgi:HEAT repeat protein